MNAYSRRQFLKSLGTAALFLALPKFSFANAERDLEMLVIGDSLVWGQGLREADKFYSLAKNRLEVELKKTVNLKVKAHSGATIFLHEKETAIFKRKDFSEKEVYHPEVSLVFPTLEKQLEMAKDEYEKAGKKASEVDFLLLSGGIVDITVAGLLNPFGNDKLLKKDIEKYCREDMRRLLEIAAETFPNTLISVIGYFPIVSPKTDTREMLNATLEAIAFPRPLKLTVNNPIIRNLFKPMKSKALKRSRIWFDDSNSAFQAAVDRVNTKLGKERIIFIKSPFTEENALNMPNTYLFKMGAKGRVNDFAYDERSKGCREVRDYLKKRVGIKESIRQCEVAGLGHPNVAGAKAYADKIVSVLTERIR